MVKDNPKILGANQLKIDMRNNKTIRPLEIDKKVKHSFEKYQQNDEYRLNNSHRDNSLNPLIIDDDQLSSK